MKIEAVLEKLDNEEEVLKFRLTPEKSVRLTSTQGVNDLKDVFVTLLNKLTTDDVLVELVDNPDYDNKMYRDICAEYVVELNKDIAEARRNLIKEGLVNVSEPSAEIVNKEAFI